MNRLSSYPVIKRQHLCNWTPTPEPHYHYEQDNPEYGIKPTVTLSLRKSDYAMNSNTNGYLTWWSEVNWYPQNGHHSYPYSQLLADCNDHIRSIDEVSSFYPNAIVIPFCSVYSNWNQGHELSVAAYTYIAYTKTVEMYPDSEVYLAVRSKALEGSQNTRDLIKCLFPEDRILELDTDTLYEFERFVSPPANDYYLNNNTLRGGKNGKDEPLVSEALDKIQEYARENTELHRNSDKFALVKTEEHRSYRKSGIVPKYVLDSLESDGWYVINPEKLSFMEVISLLGNAKKVLFGSGAVQYAHKYFPSRDAIIYRLFNTRNYPAYDGQTEVKLELPEDNATEQQWKNVLIAIR